VILKKPCETPSRLNLAHPYAQGLVASYLFNGQGSKVFDYTCNQNDLSITGASYVADGVQFDANGEYALLDNTNQVVNSDRGTILMYIKSYESFTDGILHFLFRCFSPGLDILLAKKADSTLQFYFYNGLTVRYIKIAEPEGWESGVLIGAHWDKDNKVFDGIRNFAISVNGEFKTITSASNSNALDSFTVPDMYLFNHSDENLPFDGVCKFAYLYNCNIPLETVKSIHKDPYSMYNVYSNVMFSFFFSVSLPLVITTQPESTTVAKETDASFSVEATGSGTLTYQWYRNSESQAGETSSTYSFTTALSNNNDSVYCIVSDDNSSLQSDTVFLTVVSCVMNTNADVLEEKDYPIPQKIEYKEAHEK